MKNLKKCCVFIFRCCNMLSLGGKMDNIINVRRKELGLSLEDVGKSLGVHKSTVMRWEKGDIASLKSSHVYLLSKTLYLPIEVLLGLESTTPIENGELIKYRVKIQNMLQDIKSLEDLEKLEKYIKFVVLSK